MQTYRDSLLRKGLSEPIRSIPEALVIRKPHLLRGGLLHRSPVKDVLPATRTGIGKPHAPMLLHITGIIVSCAALASESLLVMHNIWHYDPLVSGADIFSYGPNGGSRGGHFIVVARFRGPIFVNDFSRRTN